MKDIKKLTWSDIQSDLMNPKDFKQKINDKVEKWKNYKEYKPDPKTIEKIKTLLKKRNEKVKIIAIGAEWCGDCAIQLPRMLKISEQFDKNIFEFYVLYGVMVDALKKNGDSKWHEKKSPPEATDPKFNLHAIPTIYMFDNQGQYLSRIVEKPTKKGTLEDELFYLLKKTF